MSDEPDPFYVPEPKGYDPKVRIYDNYVELGEGAKMYRVKRDGATPVEDFRSFWGAYRSILKRRGSWREEVERQRREMMSPMSQFRVMAGIAEDDDFERLGLNKKLD
jgi:hypothetical protein